MAHRVYSVGGVKGLVSALALVGCLGAASSAMGQVEVVHGSFARRTSAGTQTIDVGFQPKALIFWWAYQTGVGYTAAASLGYGFTDGVNDASVAVAMDNLATSNVGGRHSNADAITILSNGTPTVAARANLQSFDALGFTLNWAAATNNADLVYYTAIGGPHITQVGVGSLSVANGATSATVNTLGFQPDLVMLLAPRVGAGVNATSTSGALSLGLMTATDQYALGLGGQDGQGTATYAHTLYDTRALIGFSTAGVAMDSEWSRNAFNANGFVLTGNNTPGGTQYLHYLAIQGGGHDLGLITQPTATGAQAVTGAGFPPTAAMLFSHNDTTLNSVRTATPAGKLSGGAASGTSESSVWVHCADGVNTQVIRGSVADKAILLATRSGTATATVNAAADLQSFDGDGFTLGWTSADATQRRVVYWAIGCVGAGGPLAVTPGQTLVGSPVDLTSISSTSGAANVVYTVSESCSAGATQTDDYAAYDGQTACTTSPPAGNWVGGGESWSADSNGGNSGGTGPSSGNPGGYVFLESSASGQSCGATGVTAGTTYYLTNTTALDASQSSYTFEFDWNMNVNDNTNAVLDLQAWNGAAWVDVTGAGSTVNTGNAGDVWNHASYDLAAFTNADLQLRLAYTVGTGTIFNNDVAFDNLTIAASSSSLFSGNATQALTVDTAMWPSGPLCLRVTGSDSCGRALTPGEGTFTFVGYNENTVAGTVTAVPSGCNAIALSAPYSSDDDGNNSARYRIRTPSGSGAFGAWVNLSHSASPYTATLGGLVHNATYDVELELVEVTPDVVTGTNPQVVSNILVGGDCTGAGTVAWAQATGATPTVVLTAPYTGDANGSNTLGWAFNLAGPNGTATHGPSPYQVTAGNLTCGANYTATVTYNDLDGLGAGTSPQNLAVTPNHCTTPGASSANVDSCSQLTVSAPFAYNANGNGTVTFERSVAGSGGPWTTVCTVTSGGSPRQCVDGGRVESTNYWYRVTYTDPDAVDGVAQQVIGPINTGQCYHPAVTPLTATATVDGCSQLTVIAPFTGDVGDASDPDSSTTFRVGPSATGPWADVCTGLTLASPRTCQATSLGNATTYHVQVQFYDPDGVDAPATQVIGPYTTADCRVAIEVPTASALRCDRILVSAPFAGDFDGDSTTTFERSKTGGAPWTALPACTSVGGASPRQCDDADIAGATGEETYTYRVTFADGDGIVGTNPQTASAVTPPCAQNDTTPGTAYPERSSCSQLTVTAPFTGDDNGNGSVLVEWNTSNTWPGTAACTVSGPSPRTCAITGLTASTTYYTRVTYNDVDNGSWPASPARIQALGGVSTGACGGNNEAPMVMFLSPARGAIVGGIERFVFQVYDPSGVSVGNVKFALDSADPAATIGVTYAMTGVTCELGNQTPGTCLVAYVDLDTTTLANGGHYLTVRATDSAATPSSGRYSLGFEVQNLGLAGQAVPAGAGNLLRRTNSPNLCGDCHTIQTHSSQGLSSRYGSWAMDCLVCHTPHESANLYLVREKLQTPNSGLKSVDFRSLAGVSDYGLAELGEGAGGSNGIAAGNGICEVCHTKTVHWNSGNPTTTPRFRNTGEGANGHPTSKCTSCHNHGKGFAAGESEGEGGCEGCHSSIWEGMTTVTATSAHPLAPSATVSGAYADNGVTWTSPLSGNAASARSCVNMCHQDHIHNAVGDTLHNANAHRDASTAATRAVTRSGGYITAGTPAATDFESTATNGGMCVSCHRNPITAGGQVIARDTYAASAHNYTSNGYGTWTYTQHDANGAFARNCTKCHSGSDTVNDDATYPFDAVHFSAWPKLLFGSHNPGAAASGSMPDPTPANFVCYQCHGNGTTGTNRSGKNIATQVAKASRHEVDLDSTHDSNAEYGKKLGSRHVSCMDCHETHAAASDNPIKGAMGVVPNYTGVVTGAVPTYAFTRVTSRDDQYQVCFRCHTGYEPTRPSAQQDLGIYFNPANVSMHYVGTDLPVPVNSTGDGLGIWHLAQFNLAAVPGQGTRRYVEVMMPRPQWSTFTVDDDRHAFARSLPLRCSDCHGDSVADGGNAIPEGPHGSDHDQDSGVGVVRNLLKVPSGSPYTVWDAASDVGDTNVWCYNCHSPTFAGSGFAGASTHAGHDTKANDEPCRDCHLPIPHGSVPGGGEGSLKHLLNPVNFNNNANLENSGSWLEHGAYANCPT